MNRICSVCKIEKDLNEFYKSKTEKLGREYRCKSCTHLKYKKYRAEKGVEWNEKTKIAHKNKLEENPNYFRELYQKCNGKEKMRIYRERNRDRDYLKCLAQKTVQYHVNAGNLDKPTSCSICGIKGKRIEAHHENYLEQLDIIWVCSKCHHVLDKLRRERESGNTKYK